MHNRYLCDAEVGQVRVVVEASRCLQEDMYYHLICPHRDEGARSTVDLLLRAPLFCALLCCSLLCFAVLQCLFCQLARTIDGRTVLLLVGPWGSSTSPTFHCQAEIGHSMLLRELVFDVDLRNTLLHSHPEATMECMQVYAGCLTPAPNTPERTCTQIVPLHC